MRITTTSISRTLPTRAARAAVPLGTALGLALAAVAPVAQAGAPATIAAASGHAADRGLFGAQDPTYDGVYRQGLAITGLVAVDRRVPRSSIDWLLRQQCDNGSFQAYRTDPTADCAPSDPVNFSGPDSNSTAMAAMALFATGHTKQGNAAIRWLLRLRNGDGGFAYYRGGTSDANSTGLALAALNPLRYTVGRARAKRAGADYLKSLMLKCQAAGPDRGMISYVADPLVANLSATAQAAVGLVTSFPAYRDTRGASGRPITCDNGVSSQPISVRHSVLAAARRALMKADGLLPSSLGTGSDPASTAQVAIALTSADRAGRAVRLADARLRRVAAVFTGEGVSPKAGELGTLLLFAGATDSSPRRFGGVDLVRSLVRSRR
jgi:hypothetical protein